MNPIESRSTAEPAVGKVPEVVLGFWVIKIAATTLGETGCPVRVERPERTSCG